MGEVLLSLLSAVIISFVTYFSKMTKADGEFFDIQKIARTALVGLAIGVISIFTGVEVTTENWYELVASYAGVVTVVDQLVKMIFRAIRRGRS